MQHLIASQLDSNADKRIAEIIAMASSFIRQTLFPFEGFSSEAASFPFFSFEHLTPLELHEEFPFWFVT